MSIQLPALLTLLRLPPLLVGVSISSFQRDSPDWKAHLRRAGAAVATNHQGGSSLTRRARSALS